MVIVKMSSISSSSCHHAMACWLVQSLTLAEREVTIRYDVMEEGNECHRSVALACNRVSKVIIRQCNMVIDRSHHFTCNVITSTSTQHRPIFATCNDHFWNLSSPFFHFSIAYGPIFCIVSSFFCIVISFFCIVISFFCVYRPIFRPFLCHKLNFFALSTHFSHIYRRFWSHFCVIDSFFDLNDLLFDPNDLLLSLWVPNLTP